MRAEGRIVLAHCQWRRQPNVAAQLTERDLPCSSVPKIDAPDANHERHDRPTRKNYFLIGDFDGH
jgi:hypothetical protein